MIRHCRECRETFAASKAAAFCPGTSCRRDWNNRRQQRGAQLYDVFMTMRGERQLTTDLKNNQGINLWTVACQLAADWKLEDEQQRGGRRSYQFIPDLIKAGKFAYLAAVCVGVDRTGRFSKPVARKASS